MNKNLNVNGLTTTHQRAVGRRPGRALAGVVALTAAACGLVSCTTSTSTGRAGAAYLTRFNDCDAMVDWFRDTYRDRVTAWGLDGGAVSIPRPVTAAEGRADSVSNAGAVWSTTNVQESGIDEGDLAENNGRHVYSVVGNTLKVLDTEEPGIVSDVDLPDGEHRMILVTGGDAQDILVVASTRWSASGPSTVVSRFGVDDGEPTLLGADHLEGTLVEMRGIERNVHLVLRHDPVGRLAFVQPGVNGDEAAALEANRAVVAGISADDVLPRTYPDARPGMITGALDCDRVGTPQDYSGNGLTWVATVNVDRPEDTPAGTAGVTADATEIYASSQNLYVATTAWSAGTRDLQPLRPEPVSTAIHAFDLTGEDDDPVTYRASGRVDGRIVSSYSLSEYDGYLRVATTTDATDFGRDTQSGIRVLKTVDDRLEEIGLVDGLGVGETIQGVRFSGTLAFVVTFRQIDPLYIVDLSDPENPRRRGELKIPGFSTWLRPVENGLLLAFGRAGTIDGQITGVQWSLFDVNDLDNPTLVDTLDAGGDSEGVWDPLALTFEPSSGYLISPSTTWTTPPVQPSEPGSVTDETQTVDAAIDAIWPGQEMVLHNHVVVGRLVDGRLEKVVTVNVQAGARRAMLVNGNLVTVNADGSFTVADPETGNITANLK